MLEISADELIDKTEVDLDNLTKIFFSPKIILFSLASYLSCYMILGGPPGST